MPSKVQKSMVHDMGPIPLLDFSPLCMPEVASPGLFALTSFLVSLMLGLLYESNNVCFVCFAAGAIGLLPLHANMQDSNQSASVRPWRHVNM